MDPLVQENWFEAYDIIREESHVYYMPQTDMYILTHYNDIEYVLKRPTLFKAGSDVREKEPLITFKEARDIYNKKGWERFAPLGENLPQHKYYRQLVDPALTISSIRKKEKFIKETINNLIDKWIDKKEIEFIKEFAEPLPMLVIAELLGLPRMDVPQLKEWSEAWVLPWTRGLTLEEEKWAVNLHIELQHYIYETLNEKRKKPKDDIISRLANIEFEDVLSDCKRKLTDTEIIGITDHLLIGGNETTTFALSNSLWLLFQYPEIFPEMQRNPKKIKNFVEEALRIESPTQGLFRVVNQDTDLRGVKLTKGSTISVRYGAGNHDAKKFPNPTVPDLSRKNAGRHLAFGLGEHVCPGAALSRYEQNLAWEILTQRLKNIYPAPEKDDYSHVLGFWIRALKTIHMRFEVF